MQTCNLYTFLAHRSTHPPTCEAIHLTGREPCHELDGGIFLHIAQRANMLWARFQLRPCRSVCVCGREHALRTRKRPPCERESMHWERAHGSDRDRECAQNVYTSCPNTHTHAHPLQSITCSVHTGDSNTARCLADCGIMFAIPFEISRDRTMQRGRGQEGQRGRMACCLEMQLSILVFRYRPTHRV